MKKIFAALCIFAFAVACNSGTDKDNKTDSMKSAIDSAADRKIDKIDSSRDAQKDKLDSANDRKDTTHRDHGSSKDDKKGAH